MFRLVRVEDVVKVAPPRFGIPRWQALEDEVNAKYVNRVLQPQGLCLGLWDWISKGDDRILYGDGGTQTLVVFRMVLFQPQEGDVMLGRVNWSNLDGINISLEFFEDIHVPVSGIQTPAEFNVTENAWVWKYEGNELFIYEGDLVWFKVLDVVYEAESGGGGGVEENETSSKAEPAVTQGSDRELKEPVKEPRRKSPMMINATIAGDGLGVMSWWT